MLFEKLTQSQDPASILLMCSQADLLELLEKAFDAGAKYENDTYWGDVSFQDFAEWWASYEKPPEL